MGSQTPTIDFAAGTFEFEDAPDGAPDLANETLGAIDVPMSVPFTFRGVHFEKVSLRVPSGADVRDFCGLSHERVKPPNAHEWLVRLLEAPKEILDVMHGLDYLDCLQAASDLLKPKL